MTSSKKQLIDDNSTSQEESDPPRILIRKESYKGKITHLKNKPEKKLTNDQLNQIRSYVRDVVDKDSESDDDIDEAPTKKATV